MIITLFGVSRFVLFGDLDFGFIRSKILAWIWNINHYCVPTEICIVLSVSGRLYPYGVFDKICVVSIPDRLFYFYMLYMYLLKKPNHYCVPTEICIVLSVSGRLYPYGVFDQICVVSIPDRLFYFYMLYMYLLKSFNHCLWTVLLSCTYWYILSVIIDHDFIAYLTCSQFCCLSHCLSWTILPLAQFCVAVCRYLWQTIPVLCTG